jgi:hypothetical protein
MRAVDLRWGKVPQGGVGSFSVVDREIIFQSGFGLLRTLVVPEIDLLVLDRAPEALDEDVVEGAAATVHADCDPACCETAGELGARELAPLVRVEDLRLRDHKGLVESLETDLWDRKLLGLLARTGAETLKVFYREMTGEPTGVPGIMAGS